MTRRDAVGGAQPGSLAVRPRRSSGSAGERSSGPRLVGRRWLAAAVVSAILVTVVVWALIAAMTPTTARLVVWDHGEEEVAFARELAVGETFRLEHTHSVTRRTVVETFSVQDEVTIAIEELWFDEPGPNLPAGPEPLGDGTTTFLQEDGAFRVLHHGHPIGTLPLMVGGPDVDHTLVFPDGQQVHLLDVVRRGERVEVMVGDRRG